MSNNQQKINISEFFCVDENNLYSITELLNFFGLEDNNGNRRLLSKTAKNEGIETKIPQKKGYKRETHFYISLKQEEKQEEKEENKEQNKNKIIILPYQYKTDEKSETTDFYLMRCLGLKYSRKIIMSKVEKNGVKTRYGYLKIIGYTENSINKYIEPFLNEETITELPEKFQKLIMSKEEIENHSLYSWENNKVFLNKQFLTEYEEGFLERFQKEEEKAEELLKEKEFYIKRKEKEDLTEYLQRYDKEIEEVLKYKREKEEKEADLREQKRKEMERYEKKIEQNINEECRKIKNYVFDCDKREKLIAKIENKNTSVNALIQIGRENNLNMDWIGLNTLKNEVIDYILNNLPPVRLE